MIVEIVELQDHSLLHNKGIFYVIEPRVEFAIKSKSQACSIALAFLFMKNSLKPRTQLLLITYFAFNMLILSTAYNHVTFHGN